MTVNFVNTLLIWPEITFFFSFSPPLCFVTSATPLHLFFALVTAMGTWYLYLFYFVVCYGSGVSVRNVRANSQSSWTQNRILHVVPKECRRLLVFQVRFPSSAC